MTPRHRRRHRVKVATTFGLNEAARRKISLKIESSEQIESDRGVVSFLWESMLIWN